jgi:membrane protein
MTSIAVATRPLAKRALRVSVRVVRAMSAHNAFEASAAVAFWLFLSLVPLLVLGGFLVGQVARTKGVDALVGPLLDVVPATAEGIVRKAVERLAGGDASSLAPLGAAGFLWTASSGLHNLMRVVETAAQVKRRPWWKQRGIALAWVVLGLAITCFLATVIVEIDSALHDHPHHAVIRTAIPKRSDRRGFNTTHESMIAATMMLVGGMALLGGLYRFAAEHPPGARRCIWPGTITAVLCWLAVSWGFGVFAVSVATYALYYGSLAAVAVLLVWLYLTSLSLVVGAEVNADLERDRADRRRPERLRRR